jgi:hypothetical protein
VEYKLTFCESLFCSCFLPYTKYTELQDKTQYGFVLNLIGSMIQFCGFFPETIVTQLVKKSLVFMDPEVYRHVHRNPPPVFITISYPLHVSAPMGHLQVEYTLVNS